MPIAVGNSGLYRNPINPLVVQNFFQPRAAQRTPQLSNETSNTDNSYTHVGAIQYAVPPKNKYVDPTVLRKVIDDGMDAFRNQGQNEWLHQFKYNEATGLLVDYIYKLTTHRKGISTSSPLPGTEVMREAMKKYHAIFQNGSMKFEVPHQFLEPGSDAPTPSPSPYFDALVGLRLMYVDWRLVVDFELLCFNCEHEETEGGTRPVLLHDRTNWSRNKSLFPIFDGTGAPTLCILMYYKCERCNKTWAANDGRLLMTLPAHVRNRYPVLPRFARGTFHVSNDASSDLQDLLRTYANAKFVSGAWYKKLGAQYERKVEAYLSLHPSVPFMSFSNFRKGHLPPSPSSLRNLFLEAEESPLTPYGYSFCARYARELQSVSVGPDDTIAIDWTFQSMKNYSNLPGAKAIFTSMTGKSKEILTLGIVQSTAVKEVAHMVVSMVQKRTQFSPAVLYTDTCPNNDSFWKRVLGDSIHHGLGLFHLLHRVFETLDPRSEVYWDALVALKKSVYNYAEEDLSALKSCLSDGTFSKSNYKFSSREIVALERSKRWKQRYDPYLRKIILPGHLIQSNLKRWVDDYQGAKDRQDRPLFTAKTKKTTQEQLSKVGYASDPPGVLLYRKIPPGKRSPHNLPKWRSNRAESGLEKMHELLAHFANTGMRPALADALTLGGAAGRNIEARWQQHVNTLKLEGRYLDGPSHFEDIPPFQDHSMLGLLNDQARSLELPPPFEFCTPICKDNGEVFLSQYFVEQQRRNDTVGSDSTNRFCQCHCCVTYLSENRSARTIEQQQGAQCVAVRAAAEEENRNCETRVEPRVFNPYAVSFRRSAPLPLPIATNDVRATIPRGFIQTCVGLCYPFPPWRCIRQQKIHHRRAMGLNVSGRRPNRSNPDHDPGCPAAVPNSQS